MTDFDTELAARLARNAELAAEREQVEREMDRARREREEAEADRRQELERARGVRHAELVEELTRVLRRLKAASPQEFVVRMGWTESGDSFLAKVTTRGLAPARSLLVELDRPDDEVLARWRSDVGDSLALWRVLQVTPPHLAALVLQVADQELWHRRDDPPPFPQP